MAEWSKALVLGTSLSGRGFESHRCQSDVFLKMLTLPLTTLSVKDFRWR